MKNKKSAYLFWLLTFLCISGMHRFYLRKYGTGVLWLLTLGLAGVGSLFDLFTLGGQVEQFNTNVELKTIRKATTPQSQ